jgi:CO/xanthine dehydrogenase FAD-binding subunit
LQEAIDLPDKYAGNAKIIAGGTDVMIRWTKGFCHLRALFP